MLGANLCHQPVKRYLQLGDHAGIPMLYLCLIQADFIACSIKHNRLQHLCLKAGRQWDIY